MQTQQPRYAVYFVPAADSDLYRFGSAVLGYDCYLGKRVRRPREFEPNADRWRRATREPRRYGFHATLKAPFRLSASCTEAQLISALRSFAALGRNSATVKPAVQLLSGFVAVLAERPTPAVESLAADCTTIFDAFRAPMTAQERARRLASGLNPSQIANLDRWGYPYLFGDFRFHMTLTGTIPPDRQHEALSTLRAVHRRMCESRNLIIDRVALVRQDTAHSAFRVLSQALLRGAES